MQKEYKDCLKKIDEYQKILGSRKQMDKVIKADLSYIRKEFALPRKTLIEDGKEAVYVETPLEAQEVAFVMDRFGYCKVLDKSIYERNKETVDGEYRQVISCMNTDKLCIFTDTGNLHQVKLTDIPQGKLRDKGTPLDNVSKFDGSKENIVWMASWGFLAGKKLFFATRQALVKIVPAEEFITNNRTVASTKLQDGDLLLTVRPADGETQLVLQTTNGVFLRFAMEEISEMKKNSRGIRGIKLDEGEWLEKVYFVSQEPVITYGKKELRLNRIKLDRRDGKGVMVKGRL